jgi:hypothetical protein
MKPDGQAPRLTNNIMHDGSRCFLSLRPVADRYAVRDHVARLDGAELTGFLTDDVTEAWIDFRYAGHEFNINDSPGDYWFFVADPACPDSILEAVAAHFSQILK